MNDKPSAALPVHTDHTNLSFSSSYSSQVLSLNSDSSSILSLSVLNLFIILFMNLMICDFCLQKKENITLIGLKIVLTNPALCQSLKIYSLCKQQAMRCRNRWFLTRELRSSSTKIDSSTLCDFNFFIIS
ncbi:hypothetical protein I3843_05G090700 [Carya illinoinensis]|nr:hypothetical protein I3843_05G090700 [Carya illinoinensis]